ncbi:TIGR04255 family protein [Pseudomonas anguilliseptica]|uniref:TIGR04255 family protein n=1 Tax=Pseudomonas anguilliseptica TaxID=53406 RepID=UPI0022AF7966|nr:TIGR04255 family protein [Pseudomonas anguilliseptica]MCZ4324380.1 TIGR04255 family protein [Pseudomonas anguilliseptica]
MAATIKPFDTQHGHAISNVLIIFEFATPLAPHAFADLKAGGSLHELLKEDLPRVIEKQQMMLNFAMGAERQMVAPPVSMPGVIGGISFASMRRDGEPALAVNIETGALYIDCGVYERWAKVADEVAHYLDILRPWLSSVATASLSLQYTDTFKVTFDDGQVAPLTELFNPDSRYLPSGIGQIDDAFHSHHGFFSSPNFGLDGKILTNINVNVNRVASNFDVNIVTLHKYLLSAALPFIEGSGEINTHIAPAFKYLHDESKAVFGNVITEAVKREINFDTRKSD